MNRPSFRLHEYDSAMAQLMGEIREGLLEHDPLLGKIRNEVVSHGGTTRQVTGPNVVETPMVKSTAMFEINKEAFLETDTHKFAESILNLFESFHREQKKYLLEVVSKTTEAVGNVVDAHNRNFWDAYLEMIETTEMQFDEHGNHNYQIVLHPETAKKIQATPPTEEQSKRIEEAIERKRREYYERKPSRKLF
jgi:hypothetical protein